jgi:hypothetical protein
VEHCGEVEQFRIGPELEFTGMKSTEEKNPPGMVEDQGACHFPNPAGGFAGRRGLGNLNTSYFVIHYPVPPVDRMAPVQVRLSTGTGASFP